MSKEPAGASGSNSSVRTLKVLETLVNSTEPITLTELGRRCDIPLATCSAIAATLEARGYAQRHVVGRSHLWRPTLRLYGLGIITLHRLELGSEAEPLLRRLRDEVDLPAHLGVLDGASVIYVAKASTTSMVQFNTYPGRISPFNVTALGKSIAAFRPEYEREDLIDHAAQGRGPNAGHGSKTKLRDLFATIREQGFAVEDQEEEAGIACVAAPVLGSDGLAVAAVGVTGFEHQVLGTQKSEIIHAVVQTANTLAQRTGLRPGFS